MVYIMTWLQLLKLQGDEDGYLVKEMVLDDKLES